MSIPGNITGKWIINIRMVNDKLCFTNVSETKRARGGNKMAITGATILYTTMMLVDE